MATLMKKAASSVISLANRTPHRRNYTCAIFFSPLKNSTINTSCSTYLFRQQAVFRTATYHHHYLSTLANQRSYYYPDNILVGVIESEIDRAEEEFDDLEVAEAPVEFPFKMEENARELIVTLTREYQGEEIIVTARGSSVSHAHINEEEKKSKEFHTLPYVHMVISVTKKSRPALKFNVSAYAHGIRDVKRAYQGPKFASYDTKLQVDLRAYLEARGITPSLTKFLVNHMVSKEHKKYIVLLNSLKSFIAN